MLTKTSSTAYIEISTGELAAILTKHFQKEIKMKPTEVDFVFSGDCKSYNISGITFIARKVIEHNPKD